MNLPIYIHQNTGYRPKSRPVWFRVLLSILSISFVVISVGCQFYHTTNEQVMLRPIHDRKDLSALDLLLGELNLKRQDLGIYRTIPSQDSFLLNKVPLFLNSPLQTISFAADCTTAFSRGQNSLSSILKVSADLMEIEIENVQQDEVPLPEEFGGIPPSPLREAIEILYPALVQGKRVFERAFDGLSQEEVDFCRKRIESLLFPALKDKSLLHHENQERIERAFFLASKVDRKKILEACYIVASALDKSLKILKVMDPEKADPLLKEEKTVLHTPLGEIVIGGIGDNSYEGKMPLLLIDIGGNDQYRFDEYSPFSLIIDLSGNDRYHSWKSVV